MCNTNVTHISSQYGGSIRALYAGVRFTQGQGQPRGNAYVERLVTNPDSKAAAYMITGVYRHGQPGSGNYAASYGHNQAQYLSGRTAHQAKGDMEISSSDFANLRSQFARALGQNPAYNEVRGAGVLYGENVLSQSYSGQRTGDQLPVLLRPYPGQGQQGSSQNVWAQWLSQFANGDRQLGPRPTQTSGRGFMEALTRAMTRTKGSSYREYSSRAEARTAGQAQSQAQIRSAGRAEGRKAEQTNRSGYVASQARGQVERSGYSGARIQAPGRYQRTGSVAADGQVDGTSQRARYAGTQAGVHGRTDYVIRASETGVQQPGYVMIQNRHGEQRSGYVPGGAQAGTQAGTQTGTQTGIHAGTQARRSGYVAGGTQTGTQARGSGYIAAGTQTGTQARGSGYVAGGTQTGTQARGSGYVAGGTQTGTQTGIHAGTQARGSGYVAGGTQTGTQARGSGYVAGGTQTGTQARGSGYVAGGTQTGTQARGSGYVAGGTHTGSQASIQAGRTGYAAGRGQPGGYGAAGGRLGGSRVSAGRIVHFPVGQQGKELEELEIFNQAPDANQTGSGRVGSLGASSSGTGLTLEEEALLSGSSILSGSANREVGPTEIVSFRTDGAVERLGSAADGAGLGLAHSGQGRVVGGIGVGGGYHRGAAAGFDGFGRVIVLPPPAGQHPGAANESVSTKITIGEGAGKPEQPLFTRQPVVDTTVSGGGITVRAFTPSASANDSKAGGKDKGFETPIFSLRELYELLVKAGQIIPDSEVPVAITTTASPYTNVYPNRPTHVPSGSATSRRPSYGLTTAAGGSFYGGSGVRISSVITSSLLPGGGIVIDIPVGTSKADIKHLRQILQAMSPHYYYFLQSNTGVAKMGGLPYYPVRYAQTILIPYAYGLGSTLLQSLAGDAFLEGLLRAGFGIGSPDGLLPKLAASCKTLKCDHICNMVGGKATCTCRRGYLLQTDGITCKDVNECDDNNGGCGHLCINTAGSYHCSCLSEGYKLDTDGKACLDINECFRNNGGCSDFCENSEGSYRCYCPLGYHLDKDEKTCIDTNECREAAGNSCEQLCSNAAGAYHCDCYKGYALNPFDMRSCDDVDECSLNTDQCDQVCVNTPGSYECQCQKGYTLARDSRTCLDQNECLQNNGDCSQRCVNTAGSYKCECHSGYKLNTDLRTCDDADECATNNGNCAQICQNTVGSFECSCETGYQLDLDKLTCRDVNECLVNNGGCEHTCHNILGSYRCSCFSGYTLNSDNRKCDAMDACAVNNGGCDHICTSTAVGRRCSCNTGYRLDTDGKTCVDENECLINNGGCAHLCQNSLGTYTCSCRSGFVLDPDRLSCNDINECLTDNGGCASICENNIGSYYCSCNHGYELATDNRMCLDINECLINNGGCEQICTNTEGSYLCSCVSDLFEIDPLDGKTCVGKCPQDFIRGHGLNSCYKVFTPVENDARSAADATEKCQAQHPDSQLVSIETSQEQEFLSNYLRSQPEMLDGWQGWWTGGIYRDGINQFQWRTGSSHRYIDNNSPYWGFKRLPYENTCVWILQIPAYNYTWGNYDCDQKSGFICEIELTK